MTIKQQIKKILGLRSSYIPYKVYLTRRQELQRSINKGVIPLFNNHKTNGSLKGYSHIIKKPYSSFIKLKGGLKE